MTKSILLFLTLSLFTIQLFSQSVGINNNAPDASAILDVKSSAKGLLTPRMTGIQRTAIASPAAGLLVFDTDTKSFWFYNGTIWSNLSASGIGGSGTGNYLSKFNASNSIGNSQLFDNGTNVGISTVSPFAKLHIKGSADATQLFIDANAAQSNSNPLISLRRSDGVNLMSIHSDNPFNTFIGLYSGSLNNAAGGGIYNTFIGRDAGASNTTGYANNALGVQALQLNTTGIGNTANGAEALQSNIVGNENTAIGAGALQFSTVSNSTAIGFKALWLNIAGNENTATGHSALLNNNYGSSNTANGHKALYSNINASFNTATGDRALYLNTSGYSNTGDGAYALYYNTIGYENTAIGMKSLSQNTTASRNTAIGTNALYTQSYNNGGASWESGNVAVGYNALYLNSPTSAFNGIQNTAVGNYALQGNTTGKLNIASGYASLVSNNTGSYNTAFGPNSLHDNISGHDNTATGLNALYKNNTGNQNTAIGSSALYSNTSGSYNTAIGDGALYYLNGGSDNIAIGAGAGTTSGSPGVTNTVGIGNGGYPIGSSNTVILGNASTSFIGGAVGFTNQSDARIKNNTAEDVKGLDFILRLRPVTYHVSVNAITAITAGPTNTANKQTADFPEKYDREKIKYSGFIAQEVEQAAKAVGYDFSGIYIPAKSTDLYGLRYAEFVVPLVKAMQEQQAIIEALQKNTVNTKKDNTIQTEQQAIITQLQQQVLLLEKRLAAVETKQ